MPENMAKLPLHYLLLLSLILPLHVISQSTINRNDQTILLNLKQFWSDPPAIDHWNQSSDPCTWPEINCVANSVTGITLVDINIVEIIPPFICDLKNLTHLDLNFNYIPGKFPTTLYNCTNLQYLDLSNNYFVGSIPDDISRLSPELRFLSLAGNNFSGDIPANISRLSKLTTLYLHQNLFNGSFPPEIGNLKELEHLGLASNDFVPSMIPQSFTQLKKLKEFYMKEANLIGEIPENLSAMSAIEKLDLSVNRLTGKIPSTLFLLKNLTEVYLYGNNLTGEIPAAVEALNVEIIDLSANKLTGVIPEGFGNLTQLKNLSLFFNQLSGEIPVSIGRLPSLRNVRLFTNNLSGQLPPDFGRYSPLDTFEVPTNNFTGSLPENLCYNRKLIGLVVFDNNLSGGIPKSLENCSSLQNFQVYGNQFSGAIPAGLWTASSLEKMMMSGNSFSGQLPDRLAPNLSILQISGNKFSGQIPTGVSSSKSLTVFQASDNLLTGPIPQELTALPNVATLSLDGNQLSGELPSAIISWVSLVSLNLGNNQLTGPIPASLGSLPVLNALDLSRNDLSGQIPSQLGRRLSFLNVSSNRLTGVVPRELDNAAFETSFLNNPGLCASTPALGLNSCGSRPRTGASSKGSSKLVAVAVGTAVVLLILAAVLAVYMVFLYRRRNHGLGSKWKFTSFQKLSFTESTILRGLTESNVIGSGGSGKVYRIPINRSGDYVAVKRIWNKKHLDKRLEKEFLAEVEILSMVRHSNIVRLMGCISSDNSKLLVYEYLENRSLDRWLHGKRGPLNSGPTGSVHHVVFDWPKRLQIAMGAAQGLCYMHHDCLPAIVHRDVKASNILLDSDFNAKIADFGLARVLAKDDEPNTVSTVAGSFGYIAPEYAHTTKVNTKIDVYSFGVILLELTTGKEANYGDEHSSLAAWAWRHAQEGKPIADALDADITEPIYVQEMISVFKLGLLCTGTLPSTRPTMKEVCQILLRCSHLVVGEAEKTAAREVDYLPLLKNSRRESV